MLAAVEADTTIPVGAPVFVQDLHGQDVIMFETKKYVITAVVSAVFELPPPKRARPIAMTAATAMMVITITSKIGIKREREFFEYFMGLVYHIYRVFAQDSRRS